MSIQGFVTGYQAGTNTTEQIIGATIVVIPAQLRMVRVAAMISGVGQVVVDVRINGNSVWTNPANRPTLNPGLSGAFTQYEPDRSALRPGDVVTLVSVNSGNKSQIIATAALEDP